MAPIGRTFVWTVVMLSVFITGKSFSVSRESKDLEVEQAPKDQSGKNDVVINKRLLVNGAIKTTSLSTKNLTVIGDASAKVLKSSRITASLLSTDILETGVLRSPTGTITIDGNLALSGAGGQIGSFLSLGSSISSPGNQWRLSGYDDFEESVAGWQFTNNTSLRKDMRSTCGSSDKFLGGHCNLGSREVFKTFKNLPLHSKVRLKGRVHCLDTWHGEAVYAKVGTSVVWIDTCNAPASSLTFGEALNVCGSPAPDMKLSAAIDVVVSSHHDSSVKVTFGSTAIVQDACVQSWGVDDVMIFTQ